MRRLQVTRRHVPLDIADDYLAAWHALRVAALAGGARAWLFRGASHEDQFLEFVEWEDGASEPLQNEDVLAAIAQLDAFGAAAAREEWEETR